MREHRQPLARHQAAVGQRVRAPVDRGVELGIGDPQLAGDDGELVGVPANGSVQEIGDAVAAGAGGDHRRLRRE
ncbi:hypothetical protein [Streptomyces sp. NPDC046805]|uniref:hypothetical protein n=1 Tax=Streptomyces sp. NPDC046805 TaxID=3155134 RepID=UPI0033D59E15